MDQTYAHLIKEIPLLSDLSLGEREMLGENASWRKYPPGELIFREGDPSHSFIVIVEGAIEVLKALGTDGERLLAVRGKGEYLGEMSLFINNQVRSGSARARSEVSVLEFLRADFEDLLRRHPELAFRLIQEISLKARSYEDLTIDDLRQKNQELRQAYQDLKEAQVHLVAKEKLESELAVARRIQQDLLPKKLPELQGWLFAAYWQPARAVSGDFYDFISLPHDRLAVVIGDVTDKGVPAALVMAITRSVLRSVTSSMAPRKAAPSPGQMLARVNDLLCEDMPRNMFVTCLLAILDLKGGNLRFANAGHIPPYLRRRDACVELRARGLPLGLLPGQVYEEQEAQIEPGDTVLLLSDGLVEAHDPNGEMFGFARLRQRLAAQIGELRPGKAAVIPDLVEVLAEFTGAGWEQEDDITFVTVERGDAAG